MAMVPLSNAPAPLGLSAEHRKPGAGLAWAAMGVAVLGVGLGGAGLVVSAKSSRAPNIPTAAVTVTATPSAPTFAESDIDSATRDACAAITTAAEAVSAARRPFLATPPSWDDPVTVTALTHVQVVVAVELAFLRQHTPPATPVSIAGPIGEYIAGVTDAVDADTRRQSAAVSNAAATRADQAYGAATKACG
jgi:hypothetical protein